MSRSPWSRRAEGLVIALVALSVAACSTTTAAAPSSPTAGVADATPAPATSQAPVVPVATDDLLFADKLLICSDLPYPPQEFFDERGEPVGSDIEIGQEIARRLGLEAEIVNSVFDSIIPALDAGKCDIIISAQTITAERERLVDMVPFFEAGQAFVVRSGNPAAIYTELDLCGKRIVAQKGTTEVDYVTGAGDYTGSGLSALCTEAGKPRIALIEVEKDDEALAALADGDADAYFVDSPAAGYHVIRNPGSFELSGLTLDEAEQGISIPKSKPGLRRAVVAALGSMFADGAYEAILARYGVEDGSIAP
jgi:polar amino acid transport system substrate-binding protein